MAASSKKVIIAAFLGNSLIAATKFIAATFTGSSAMLSEGIHSLVDTGNQLLLLLGLRRAKKPPNDEFPFGHGKEIYFWSFVVAISIFAVGAGVSIYEGVQRLESPHPVDHPQVNYIVLGISMIFEGAAWILALREFNKVRGDRSLFDAVREGKDPSLFVVLFEDTAAMLGLLVAFAGILLGQLTGNALFDGLASIAIGLILGATAWWLAWETKGLLIGESASRSKVRGIREIVGRCAHVEHVNDVLTVHMGPDFILATISVDFTDSAHADEVERDIARMNEEIKKAYPKVKRIYIEAEARRVPVNGA